MGKWLVAVVGMLGCNSRHHTMASVDASFDGPSQSCVAAAATANVIAHVAGATSAYDRVYAGGLLDSGPVAVTQAPFVVSLLFAGVSPVDEVTAGCCLHGDRTCCTLDSVVVTSDALAFGAEVGDHAMTFSRTAEPSFSTPGTLTITNFAHPILDAPGRVAGSVSATAIGIDLDGTFDNTFCAVLVTVPI
jgi:hypothetical protein